MSFNFLKFGVPSPVTGSQPTVACTRAYQHRHYVSCHNPSTHIETKGSASGIVTLSNVVESIRVRNTGFVYQWVEKTQRRQTSFQTYVVEQCDEACECRGCRGRATRICRSSTQEDLERAGLCRYVWVGLCTHQRVSQRANVAQYSLALR